jgi:hypothetical protein
MKRATKVMLWIAALTLSLAAGVRAQVQVVKVNGAVDFQKAGAGWKTLTQTSTLAQVDTVRTGADGEAVLRWFDGNTVKVSPLTELTIDSLSGAAGQKTTLGLKKGRVLVHSKKLSTRDEFNINTPIARAGVRGTDFSATHLIDPEPKSEFEVFAGSIFVQAQEVQKIIEAEFYTTVSAGDPPLDPMAIPEETMQNLEREIQQIQSASGAGADEPPADVLNQMDDLTNTVADEILQQDMEDSIIENLLTPGGDCCNY